MQQAELFGHLSEVLCVGAHPDDIEIGCGGTLLTLLELNPTVRVSWLVLSSTPKRQEEALASADRFLGRRAKTVVTHEFRDGFLPFEGAGLKEKFEQLADIADPDLILVSSRADLHQDHRLVSELTWQTFRDHLILEYEIPKYDGDLGRPNVFVPLEKATAARKIALLNESFVTQQSKHWFTEDTFRALLRLRGIECRSESGLAEAFKGQKVVLGTGRQHRNGIT